MNKQLINLVLKSGNKELAVWGALWGQKENNNDVYLDNAFSEVSHAMNRHQFDGYLSSLKQKGSYTSIDGDFGTVSRYQD